MKPRVLLINPWIHDFAAYDFWSRPLALLEMAASLRTAGYAVSLIDCLDVYGETSGRSFPKRKDNGTGRFFKSVINKPPALAGVPRKFKRYGISEARLRDALEASERPDAVLVGSVMTYWYTGVAETIAVVRSAFPDTPVILGGVYATLMPGHAAVSCGADYVAPGDYRDALPPLLDGLSLPSDFHRGEVFPAWDLYKRLEAAAVITGRGCTYRCPYCAAHVMKPQLKRRDPGLVVVEIARLAADFGVRDAAFYDDALRAGGDDHISAILEGVIKAGLDLRLHAINALHLKGMTSELAFLLKRAKVSTLRFGLETADPERARELGGKADLDDLYQAVEKLSRAGYGRDEIGVYLLAGLPGQPPEEIERGVKEVIKAGARPIVSEYSPVPRSPMWKRAVQASRYDIESEPLFHNNTLTPCAAPELTVRELSRLKAMARGKIS